jgi:diaminohydroxyphosphoribosylaminopyrimidine deaminase / 5-amino-6-(5-phosphoribosylamino)uracil reductase
MAAKSDAAFMARAVRLSRKGFPAPNPHVGCVLVKQGRIIGEGYHHHAGGPHAEVVALGQAGATAKGSTAYVTLEPCNHTGRTPPCTEALLQAGVARVVVACIDPNPKVSGSGIARLQSHGIEVEVGLMEGEASEANERFLTSMRLGRPYVTLKAAATLDGRIALPSGESKWITGERARREGHRLRAEMGCVLVGRGTVECDDPLLTARIPGVVNQPLRVVLDPEGRLTGRERLFGEPGEVAHFVGQGISRGGAVPLPLRQGAFDLEEVLQALWNRGVTGVLVEGGPRTLSRFLAEELYDRLELFIAPKLFGEGPTWFQQTAPESVPGSSQLTLARARKVGDDLWLSYRRSEG